MNDISQQHESLATAPARRSPWRTIIILALLSGAAGAAWWFVFSPQARVKHAVHAMAAAFEKKDADGILEHFSPNYSDPAGNSFADMDHALSNFILPLLDEVDIEIKSIRVQRDGGDAVAAVTGRITYKVRGVPQREKYDEDKPAILRFRKEPQGWLVVSVENMGDSIGDLEGSYDNIKDLL